MKTEGSMLSPAQHGSLIAPESPLPSLFTCCLNLYSEAEGNLLWTSVMTCASGSGSGMWQNPTGDNQVSSTHEHGSRAKVASSMTALAHQFPPPSSSGC